MCLTFIQKAQYYSKLFGFSKINEKQLQKKNHFNFLEIKHLFSFSLFKFWTANCIIIWQRNYMNKIGAKYLLIVQYYYKKNNYSEKLIKISIKIRYIHFLFIKHLFLFNLHKLLTAYCKIILQKWQHIYILSKAYTNSTKWFHIWRTLRN